MKILITGGAGYVGSILAEELLSNGHHVVIADDLRQGHRSAVCKGAELVHVDICYRELVEKLFKEHPVEAVMHLAAETQVAYSMTNPQQFFRTNLSGGLNVLEAMIKFNVKKMIFSSSAAVYGWPESIPIKESHPKLPVNAYGESKLMFEQVLKWFSRAYGIQYISFRYFNAAGATEIRGEDHRPETHLIPNVLRIALNKAGPVSVFGTDYPTQDGSCVRDYVHVSDIARAHVMVLEQIDKISGRSFNLGNGRGYSVLEVIHTAEKVAGVKIPVVFGPRRAGDPSVLVAGSQLAEQELGWQPQIPDLESIIESAWLWQKKHPDGYSH